jgi:hypothetical protein
MLDIAQTDRNFKFLMIPSDTLFWYVSQPNTSNDCYRSFSVEVQRKWL